MSVLEIITKLSVKTVRWDHEGGRGRSNFTAFDVAACLTGGGEQLYHFACWYVNADQSSRVQLLGYLLRATQQIAFHQQWSCAENIEQLKRLCDAALIEFAMPRRCTHCKGTGVCKVAICERCAGEGQIAYTRVILARLCGVSPNNWKKIWEPKYTCVFDLLLQEKQYLTQKLLIQLKDSDSHTNHCK